MEHKSLNVVSNSSEISVDEETKSYWIRREDLEMKTLVLLQTVRAAMIYLSLGINLEEYKRPNDGPTIPIFPQVKDDKEKF